MVVHIEPALFLALLPVAAAVLTFVAANRPPRRRGHQPTSDKPLGPPPTGGSSVMPPARCGRCCAPIGGHKND